MSIDEMLAKASARMEALDTQAMSDAVAMLYATGFPEPQEIETFKKWYGELLRLDTIENLKKLRVFLERGGETLQ